MMEILAAAARLSVELAPWLSLGIAAAVLLHRALPRDFAERHLSGRGSVLKAVLLGVPLPLCSCGVLPTGLGLHKDGAGRGATVGFITSTPQTGVDSVLVSGSMLGWPFALFKLAAAAVTGWVAGRATDALDPTPAPAACIVRKASGRPSARPTWKQSLDHGVEVLQMVWPWVVVGIGVSSLLEAWVPQAWWDRAAGLGLWPSMILALVLSLPVYVCATGSVPVAATLVSHGFPAGAALVFLMAGPATNAGTLGAIWKQLGRTAAWVYLATLVSGSLLAGTLFSGVIDASEPPAPHAHFSPTGVITALALGAFVLWDVVQRLRLRMTGAKPRSAPVLEFQVQGMTCGGCVRKIQNHLLSLPGVDGTEVDREAARARVFGHVRPEAVLDAIRRAGFQASPRTE